MILHRAPVSALTIRGERAMRPLPIYAALKGLLIADGFLFLVPERGAPDAHSDRVLFLNLTFWTAGVASDLLVDASLDADVLAHTAWHHAARKALAGPRPPTAAALFLGEAVASAFDLYLIGHMLRGGRPTGYLRGQVPALSAAALGAGLDEASLAALFDAIQADPDRAFEDLRSLLFDAGMAVYAAADMGAAAAALGAFSRHRFAPFLHHYELSNWVLYARAWASPAEAEDPALVVDSTLRAAPVAMDWLRHHWVDVRNPGLRKDAGLDA